MGQDLSKMNLKGENLSGAFLIAFNMKGCDLSRADFLGADFSKSLYLTQMQLNSAKGDSSAKIPESLIRPHQ